MSNAIAIHEAMPGKSILRAGCQGPKPCTSKRRSQAGQRKRNASAMAMTWLMMKTGSATATSHGPPNTKTAITPRKETANQQLDQTISHDSMYKPRDVGCSMACMSPNETQDQLPRAHCACHATYTSDRRHPSVNGRLDSHSSQTAHPLRLSRPCRSHPCGLHCSRSAASLG